MLIFGESLPAPSVATAANYASAGSDLALGERQVCCCSSSPSAPATQHLWLIELPQGAVGGRRGSRSYPTRGNMSQWWSHSGENQKTLIMAMNGTSPTPSSRLPFVKWGGWMSRCVLSLPRCNIFILFRYLTKRFSRGINAMHRVKPGFGILHDFL